MTALLVDRVDGAIGYADAEEIPMESVIPGTKILRGILKDKEDLIFIQDIGRFLSLEEELKIDLVLESHRRENENG
jgi:chemotaxis signal transduction protein